MLIEASQRGLLPPDKKQMFDVAAERGLINVEPKEFTETDIALHVANKIPEFFKRMGDELTSFPSIERDDEGKIKPMISQQQAMDIALSTFGVSAGPKIASAALPRIKKMAESVGQTISDTFNLMFGSEKGSVKVLKRLVTNIVGPENIDNIIIQLAKSSQIVKGSKPTAAEAVAGTPAGSPIIAQQSVIATESGGTSAAFGKRIVEQQQARLKSIDKVAKTKNELSTAINKRSTNAARNFKKAEDVLIKPDAELRTIRKNPFFQRASNKASDLIESRGIDPRKQLTAALHQVKLAMDDMLSGTGEKVLARNERQAVQQVKKRLIGWLERKNTLYKKARTQFAKESKPINEMEVGQFLRDKLISPLAERERAQVFSQAVRDAPGTLKKSTGFARFTELDQVLSSGNVSLVRSVQKDLARQSQSLRPIQSTRIPGSELSELLRLKFPNILTREAMIAQGILRKGSSQANPRLVKIFREWFLDPKQMAIDLKEIPISQRGKVAQLFGRIRNRINDAISKDRVAGRAVIAGIEQENP